MTQTVGEALVADLVDRGVDVVFGIPGVHTVELYRGLAASGLRHITPRHEQGAGFMADGYARVSGRPGVAFVITGPGFTNMITPMAQARADSVPMVVISSVNRTETLGRGLGHLHELPDQYALSATVTRRTCHVAESGHMTQAVQDAFDAAMGPRPGPTHIEIPRDILGATMVAPPVTATPKPSAPKTPNIQAAADLLNGAKSPLILIGGGAKRAGAALADLAERLDAPVVQTVNARGLMHDHPLTVPASPSLNSLRTAIDSADVVLALGTEFGPTDYDMYATGDIAKMARLIRVDTCPDQLARHPTELSIVGDVSAAIAGMLPHLDRHTVANGAARAAAMRAAAWDEIGPVMRHQVEMVNTLRDTLTDAIIVGDSTQPVYAANLYYDHDRAGGWFNAATGYGALGFAIPAAIGAALAAPDSPVVALVGDGGAQFTLPELMTAKDENLNLTVVIWNNRGYGEIASSMMAAGVTVVGCDPSPPLFDHIARACDIPHHCIENTPAALRAALGARAKNIGPMIIEITA